MCTVDSRPAPAESPRFYVGTHHVYWLWMQRFFPTQFPLFISHRRLVGRQWRHGGPFRAAEAWALDSGGFTELSLHGGWRTSPEQYVTAIRSYITRLGRPDFIAPQDWMCEPFMLQRTGLSVLQHQHLTVANLHRLRELAPDLPIIPVLQGWQIGDYLRCLDMYAEGPHGIDLRGEVLVGLGSVCRRQSTDDITEIVTTLAEQGLRLHGFGVKTAGLARYGPALASADSMAWSFRARRSNPLPGCTTHKNCANCPRYAAQWHRSIQAVLAAACAQPRQLALFS